MIYNPTPYPAAPVIRLDFDASWIGGSITINGWTLSCTNPATVSDIIIDCARQDIYLKANRANRNNMFVLSDGEFFELRPGRNRVFFIGITGEIKITPNWWTV